MLERLFIFLMVIFTIGLSTGVSSARQVELKVTIILQYKISA